MVRMLAFTCTLSTLKWLSGGRRWIKRWRWFEWTWTSPTLMKCMVHIFLVYIEWHYAYRSDHYGHAWSKNTSTFVTCWYDVIRFNDVQCQKWLIVLEFSDQRNQCPALLSVKLLLFRPKYSQESSFPIGPSLGIHSFDVPWSASHHGLNNNGFDLGSIVLFVFMCNQGNNLAKSLHT